MSFTTTIKEEISRIDNTKSESIAELSGFMRNNGSYSDTTIDLVSENFACPYCDFSSPELEPRMFSFNAPFRACPDCKGLGIKLKMDPELVVPDGSQSLNLSLIHIFRES